MFEATLFAEDQKNKPSSFLNSVRFSDIEEFSGCFLHPLCYKEENVSGFRYAVIGHLLNHL